MLAVDRNNSRVAGLYDSLHPAVIQAVRDVVREGKRMRKPVGLCGEMAGDPAAAILLLGMAIDHLSMAASSLPRVKCVIRSFTQKRARHLLDKARKLDDAKSVRDLLNTALDKAELGGLVRAGR